MNKARQIREVFSELRRSIGDRASPRDLLECAASLVELFDQDEGEPNFELRTGGTPFSNWSLDAAFSDGGWRVLGFESANEEQIERDEREERFFHNKLARYALEMAA